MSEQISVVREKREGELQHVHCVDRTLILVILKYKMMSIVITSL